MLIYGLQPMSVVYGSYISDADYTGRDIWT